MEHIGLTFLLPLWESIHLFASHGEKLGCMNLTQDTMKFSDTYRVHKFTMKTIYGKIFVHYSRSIFLVVIEC